MKKYNYKLQQYEAYSVPADWHTPLYAYNFEEKLNCANCGEEIKFEDGQASMEICSDEGYGQIVCKPCHEAEWERIYKHNSTEEMKKFRKG